MRCPELGPALGGGVTVMVDGVPAQPTLAQAMNEYHKLVLRRLVLWWESMR